MEENQSSNQSQPETEWNNGLKIKLTTRGIATELDRNGRQDHVYLFFEILNYFS